MKITNVIVEAKDDYSGFVNKKIFTNEGILKNRQIAVSNFMYSCEKDRLQYDKDVFSAQFQTQNLCWDKQGNCWDYSGIFLMKNHAEKFKRIFLVYPQRNAEQLDNLKLEDSIRDFQEMKDLLDNVPFQLPLTLTLTTWKKIKLSLTAMLKPNQNLVPIISSKHDIREFPLIIKAEIGKEYFIGINSYEFTGQTEIINLSYLREINKSIIIGKRTSLFVNFGHPRVLTRMSSFPSCFGFSFFAGDVFSDKTTFIERMQDKVIKNMFNRKPSEYLMYDLKEKKFTKSPQQKGWYGEDITRKVLGGISVNEGLNGYQVHKWVSYYLLQEELNKISLMVERKSKIGEYLKNYSGWSVFLNSVKTPLISNQKTLSHNQY